MPTCVHRQKMPAQRICCNSWTRLYTACDSLVLGSDWLDLSIKNILICARIDNSQSDTSCDVKASSTQRRLNVLRAKSCPVRPPVLPFRCVLTTLLAVPSNPARFVPHPVSAPAQTTADSSSEPCLRGCRAQPVAVCSASLKNAWPRCSKRWVLTCRVIKSSPAMKTITSR